MAPKHSGHGEPMTCNGIDYDVIWDGSHHSDDADLLNPVYRIVGKIHGGHEPKRPTYHGVVRVVLEQARDWLTVQEIASESGFTHAQVSGVLFHWLEDARVARTSHAIKYGTEGRPKVGYAFPGRFTDRSQPMAFIR